MWRVYNKNIRKNNKAESETNVGLIIMPGLHVITDVMTDVMTDVSLYLKKIPILQTE